MVVIKLTNSLKKSEKFDAIVEKAGKVDANYAAQIEGYCSLLGEYGKKFEAVCAMLQPEKLRLSPDKYREKLEGINTGYQNAKDTHEQEQSDYEAELYEIETVWYKKMLDKAEDYLIRSAECIVLGNFTDEVTVLGVGVQIVLGNFDLDLPCDIRDIIADVRNLAQADEIKWDMIAMLALDLIGLIPVIGALKYSDEIGTLFKMQIKSVWWREVQMVPVCWQSMQMRLEHGCTGEKCSGIRMRQPKQWHPEKSC